MNRNKYKEYLNSLDWLLKKNELINVYKEKGWKIECSVCNRTDNLQVHHNNYDNVGNEILTDGRIFELTFMCRDCHYKWHKQKGFKENVLNNWVKDFLNI